MAGRKGFIDTSKRKKDSSSVVHVYNDMHRDRDYERQKERERERDLSHSRSMSFPEKKSYNPHVNIEYVDDKGRELTQKEAFRYMSHKFHGRGSGKRKTEKRMKKVREEHFMNRASSVDTPLNTLAMLQSKQQKSQTPYILISGGSQSMLAPDLEKK
jgi:U4/U6.U5 tri-snRNP-associated protein 1